MNYSKVIILSLSLGLIIRLYDLIFVIIILYYSTLILVVCYKRRKYSICKKMSWNTIHNINKAYFLGNNVYVSSCMMYGS